MRLDELAPAMPCQLPPARRQLARGRMLDLEELGTERLGPERKNAVDAVARQTRTEQSGRRQTAPRRFAGFGVAGRREAEAAVTAQLLGYSVGFHRSEKRGRLALRGHQRRPPLIADGGDLEQVEQLEGDVGLDQRVRPALVEDAPTQVAEPLLLER